MGFLASIAGGAGFLRKRDKRKRKKEKAKDNQARANVESAKRDEATAALLLQAQRNAFGMNAPKPPGVTVDTAKNLLM